MCECSARMSRFVRGPTLACISHGAVSPAHAPQVRVATSKDLKEQVGSKVFFDLVDFEQARPGMPCMATHQAVSITCRLPVPQRNPCSTELLCDGARLGAGQGAAREEADAVWGLPGAGG